MADSFPALHSLFCLNLHLRSAELWCCSEHESTQKRENGPYCRPSVLPALPVLLSTTQCSYWAVFCFEAFIVSLRHGPSKCLWPRKCDANISHWKQGFPFLLCQSQLLIFLAGRGQEVGGKRRLTRCLVESGTS